MVFGSLCRALAPGLGGRYDVTLIFPPQKLGRGVAVLVAVAVIVAVTVLVGVTVAVGVASGDVDGVEVEVGVYDGVGVAVRVAVGAPITAE